MTAPRHNAGKNRPLDEDELDFVERIQNHERQKDQSVRDEEKAALDAFQQAQPFPLSGLKDMHAGRTLNLCPPCRDPV